MKTLILERPGDLRAIDTAPPLPPDADHALVLVHRVGVCGTDLHAYRGRQPFFTYPRILGHELGVEIVEVGANERSLKPGDRCAVEPYINCGKCIACRHNKPNCCVNLGVLGVHRDGGMRELLLVPTRKLHPQTSLLTINLRWWRRSASARTPWNAPTCIAAKPFLSSARGQSVFLSSNLRRSPRFASSLPTSANNASNSAETRWA